MMVIASNAPRISLSLSDCLSADDNVSLRFSSLSISLLCNVLSATPNKDDAAPKTDTRKFIIFTYHPVFIISLTLAGIARCCMSTTCAYYLAF
jgi:hypothetical protein